MKLTRKTLSMILAVIAVVCLAAAGVSLYHSYRDLKETEQTLEELREAASQQREALSSSSDTASSSQERPECSESTEGPTDAPTDTPTEVPMEEPTQEPTEEPTQEPTEEAPAAVPNPYADSYLANGDMAGWLSIPGTEIDYPIMWTPEDENYYLYRDFNGKENKNGCLILDTDSCLEPLTTNLIIHGHNMKSGAMFGNLTDYENKTYYENHKEIILYTPQCQRNYEVIAVFRSQVYKKTDNVFKFYKFFQADTEEEFNDFYENIKKLSLYDTGVTAEFGDHFITLSTCVYHVEQGRFVVVAKEVESGDSYLPLEE